MANLNKAPQMGETEDDDSTESPGLQPVFYEAAFDADKRAKEQEAAQQKALQEENQRRILEFLNLGSEDDDEDEEDSKTSTTAKAKAETPKKPEPAPVPVEQSQEQPQVELTDEAGPEDELKIDHQAETEVGGLEEYDMSSEVVTEEPDSVAEAVPVQPIFDQEWTPNQGEGTASLDPDAKAEAFERTAMDEEPSSSEAPPRFEAGMDSPPPPPEEPPTANYDSFDSPPPPPDIGVETEPEQPPEEPQEEVIVERHKGGVGAALMAFFAANWLSRRRDRKLRREAQKLEKDFQKSQERAEAERRYVRQLERNSESIRDENKAKISRLERAQAEAPDNKPEQPKEGPVPLAEVLASAAYVKDKEESPVESSSVETEERIIKEKPETVEKPIEPGRAETQDDQPVAEASRESVREDAHEAKKDTKANPIAVAEKGTARDRSDQSALDAAEASLSRRNEDQDHLYRMPMDESVATEPDDLYQKSITTGVAVGVALVVLVAAVYLLF